MYEDFYRAFEDKYRGSREVIKKRLEVYLPFVLPLNEIYPDNIAIDIGCGRGEWLELLGDNNIKAKGVDSDKGMLDGAKELGLDITLDDGIEYLSKQESNSAVIISAFHLVEHLSFDNLMKLVSEANRVLVDGGILILETPNPENIKVASETFYLDPTHIKPIPYELLSFITKYNGYKRDKLLRLQENKDIHNQLFVNVGHIIEGVSPDYSIIAQKDGDIKTLSVIDEPFNLEYGLSPLMLVQKFEARMLHLENELNQAKESINNQNLRINQQHLRVDNQEINIKQNKFYIHKVLLQIQEAKNIATTAKETAGHIYNRMSHIETAIKTAQDGVDYLVKYTKDIDIFAHHIMNSLNNLKNSYSWRGISIFEKVLKKIKRKIKTKTKKIIEPIKNQEDREEEIIESYINIESPRAKEIYENLNHR